MLKIKPFSIQHLACRFGFHGNDLLATGFPAFRLARLSVNQCRRCGHVSASWGWRSLETRPSDIPVNIDTMVYTDQATPELRIMCERARLMIPARPVSGETGPVYINN